MNGQPDLFSPLHDLDLVRLLLADMHDDLYGKVGRFRQLADLSETFRIGRTILPGGETAFAACRKLAPALFTETMSRPCCSARDWLSICWLPI